VYALSICVLAYRRVFASCQKMLLTVNWEKSGEASGLLSGIRSIAVMCGMARYGYPESVRSTLLHHPLVTLGSACPWHVACGVPQTFMVSSVPYSLLLEPRSSATSQAFVGVTQHGDVALPASHAPLAG
jgi:hypothetical protein